MSDYTIEELQQMLNNKIKQEEKKSSSEIIDGDLELNFNLDDFINSLIKTIGKSGTLIFYSFNWNFFEGKVFDYNKSKSFSGSLSNAALKRKDFLIFLKLINTKTKILIK